MDPNGPNAPEKSADDGHPKARQASDSLDPGHNFVISNGCQEMTLDPSNHGFSSKSRPNAGW